MLSFFAPAPTPGLICTRAPAHLRARSCAQCADGSTALFIACETIDPFCVKHLLRRGADVNIGMQGNARPLHMTAQSGSVDIAQLLLEAGASLNAVTDGGHTAAYVAAGYGNYPVLEA